MLGYRFATEDLELRIAHERSPALRVVLEPWRIAVSVAGRRAAFGLCEMEELAAHVMAELERERRAGVKRLPLWLVAGHLLSLRERGLERVNPGVAGVLRAILAVAPRAPRVAGVRALHEEGFVARDVVRHRAAAIALASLDEHLLAPWLRTQGGAPAAGGDAAAIAALSDWRALFSPDGRTYRSLDRTLMNLPEEVPPGRLHQLRRVRLERPVTGRLGLSTLLVLLGDRKYVRSPDLFAGHATILQRASEDEVVEACALLGRHSGRDLDPSREDDLEFLVTYVLDDPGRFHGTLPGLAQRAIRGHVQRAQRAARVAERAERVAARGEGVAARPAAIPPPPLPPEPWWSTLAVARRVPGQSRRPPIPLPGTPGITFLATTAAIRAEGEHMEHCIADYADDAVDGACYLFHVSHADSEASVEVDPRGHVRQASGPRNVKNAASRWGARVLAEWGRQLRRGDEGVFGSAAAVEAPPREAPAEEARQLGLWR